jgi:hypothetical protein
MRFDTPALLDSNAGFTGVQQATLRAAQQQLHTEPSCYSARVNRLLGDRGLMADKEE